MVPVYVLSSELELSQPLSRQRVCPSPRRGGGAHTPVGEGLGESQFRRLEKKLSTLSTLWCRRCITMGEVSLLSLAASRLLAPFLCNPALHNLYSIEFRRLMNMSKLIIGSIQTAYRLCIYSISCAVQFELLEGKI